MNNEQKMSLYGQLPLLSSQNNVNEISNNIYNKDDTRLLMLNDTIDQRTIGDLIEKIYQWNIQDYINGENIKNYQAPTILLVINSYGGYATTGLGFADYISKSSTPITTICPTDACSAGFLILLGGHTRIVYENSHIMYHQLSSMVWGTKEQLKMAVDEFDILQKKMDNFVINRTKLTQSNLNSYNKLSKDWYFSNEDLYKYGIVDDIITYDDSPLIESGKSSSRIIK